MESTLAIAQTYNKIFLPAFVNRFRKDIIQFSEFVSLIGEVKVVEVNWLRKSGIPRPGTWITNKALAGGGVLIDIGTHVLDIGLSFMSDKQTKSVKLEEGITEQAEQKGAQWNTNNEGRRLRFDVETWAKGEVIFVNGSELKFNVNWSSNIEEDITVMKAIGIDGTVRINTLFGFSNNFARVNAEILYKRKYVENQRILYPMHNTFAMNAFEDMIHYFIDSINGQASKFLKSSDGVYVVDVIEQLYKSVPMERVEV